MTSRSDPSPEPTGDPFEAAWRSYDRAALAMDGHMLQAQAHAEIARVWAEKLGENARAAMWTKIAADIGTMRDSFAAREQVRRETAAAALTDASEPASR